MTPKHIEQTGRDAQRSQIFGLQTRLAQREGAESEGGDRLERLLLPHPVDVVLRRGRHQLERVARRVWTSPRLSPFPDGNQPIVLVEGQTAQHDGIDDRKDCRRRADAEDQHDERDYGEPGGRSKGSKRRSQVVHQLEPYQASGFGRSCLAPASAGRPVMTQ